MGRIFSWTIERVLSPIEVVSALRVFGWRESAIESNVMGAFSAGTAAGFIAAAVAELYRNCEKNDPGMSWDLMLVLCKTIKERFWNTRERRVLAPVKVDERAESLVRAPMEEYNEAIIII
jgi:hypothetical protein